VYVQRKYCSLTRLQARLGDRLEGGRSLTTEEKVSERTNNTQSIADVACDISCEVGSWRRSGQDPCPAALVVTTCSTSRLSRLDDSSGAREIWRVGWLAD
jgi:hypothetical protein